jgi:YggT family protein
VQVLLLIINVFEIILLLRVLISWFRVDPYNPLIRLLYDITEPVLAPIRAVLPSTGMMDFSPLVAFLLLFALRSAIRILLG